MMRNTLNQKLHSVTGDFSPLSYSIGLQRLPEYVDHTTMNYPIDENDEEAISNFAHDLSFIHEMTHYGQFIATSFGLDFYLSSHVALSSIIKGAPWQKPFSIGHNYFEKKHYHTDINNFLYYYREFSVEEEKLTLRQNSEKYFHIFSTPYHAQFEYFHTMKEASFMEQLNTIKQSNLNVHPKIWAVAPDSESRSLICCNAASLFEGMATIGELNHLTNAFPDKYRSVQSHIDYIAAHPAIYRATFHLYFSFFKLPLEYYLLSLAALIDIALMYAPISVQDSPPVSHFLNIKKKFHSSFNLFIEACIAAEGVQPIRSYDYDEQQRYQDAICRKMGIPTTHEMTEKALETADKMGLEPYNLKKHYADSLNTSSIQAMGYQHFSGLLYRYKFGAGFFSEVFNSRHIFNLYRDYRDYITYYNIETKQENGFYSPMHITSAVLANSMLEFIDGHGHPDVCPLKQGKPFYCPSATDEPDVFCGMYLKGNLDKRYECPHYSTINKCFE